MFYKSLVICSFLVLLGAGCKVNPEKEVTNSSQFEKKQECAKYKQDIENDINKNYNDSTRIAFLTEIFYSPKRDSCLYTFKIDVLNNKSLTSILKLEDYLSSQLVESMNIGSDFPHNFQLDFTKLVDSYR